MEIRMRNFLLLPLLLGMVHLAHADAGGPIYCFKPAPKQKASKLQFTFPSEGKDIGRVQYQKSKSSIEVKRLKETELKGNIDRPSRVKIEWVELPENPSSGKYVMISQGAVVDSLEYLSEKSKVFKFVQDSDAVSDRGCDWGQ
jgi:hypothetical protein